jgi:hypothetical protein
MNDFDNNVRDESYSSYKDFNQLLNYNKDKDKEILEQDKKTKVYGPVYNLDGSFENTLNFIYWQCSHCRSHSYVPSDPNLARNFPSFVIMLF